jgi:hypothetical protein
MPGPTGYNGEYAQALLKGQLHLREAPPQMAQLADPYDPAQYSPFYTFDLSYYQERIYSYFGVVPPLLFALRSSAIRSGLVALERKERLL